MVVVVTELKYQLQLAKFMFQLCDICRQHVPDAETLVMALAVGIAEAEGNPLDISAVAAITRLPRTTVLRKLRQREKQGKLVRIRDGRRVLLAPSDHQKLSKQRQDFFDQIEEAVRRCREALAELDKVRL
jgi:hypothetical protein